MTRARSRITNAPSPPKEMGAEDGYTIATKTSSNSHRITGTTGVIYTPPQPTRASG